jgi:hypothetical protein
MRGVLDTARYWVPLLAGLLCLVAATFVSAAVEDQPERGDEEDPADGATAMWERAGSTGNLTTYRQ